MSWTRRPAKTFTDGYPVPGESPGEAGPGKQAGDGEMQARGKPGSGEVGVAGSAEVREELSELLTRPENAVPGQVPGRLQGRDLRPRRLLTGRARTGAR
jgi:hypothetical protein